MIFFWGICALALIAAGCGVPDSETCALECGSNSNPGNPPPIPVGSHPIYPVFDLGSLPGNAGGAIGPYEPPALPITSRNVIVSSTGLQARNELMAACQIPGTAVDVLNSAGRIGTVDIGNATDCDITLGYDVVVDLFFMGHLAGLGAAPSHRVRVRGGRIGSIAVDPGSTDIVFDSVVVDNDIRGAANRVSTAIILAQGGGDVVNRFGFVNSVIRMLPTLPDGAGLTSGNAYLAYNARNVIFANNNIVTAGNHNSWGFRVSGGSNFIVVDNVVRVSFHKLIRMNDDAVDYVFVKGGTWLRENTPAGIGGIAFNDSITQLGDDGTDNIFVHDTEIYLLSNQPVNFGSSWAPGQAGKRWEARGISWHAVASNVISDQDLSLWQNYCSGNGISCDYGIGTYTGDGVSTHTYDYDLNLNFPANPWRNLPGLPENDPDNLPPAP